jgi:hypothetical protein
MTATTQPYCNGAGCAIKDKCGRYKTDIDKMKDSYLSLAPYKHMEKKCEFFVGDATETFIKTIKDIINGKGRKD